MFAWLVGKILCRFFNYHVPANASKFPLRCTCCGRFYLPGTVKPPR